MSKSAGRTRLSSLPDLVDAGLIPPEQARTLEPLAHAYNIGLTSTVLKTIKNPDAAADPVGRQYVPSSDEAYIHPDETADPTGDNVHSPVPGIVHRYPDRALLKLTGACAVYCRFCFRRERVGAKGHTLSPSEIETALEYLRTRTTIREVILTGGDPLVLPPRKIGAILDALESMDHIEILRLHSRVPVADPSRITPKLCAVLNRSKAVYLCLHVNHANELTESVRITCRALHATGCVLLSQSVLLKGVNDTAEALEALFRKLTAFRIKPYYLHHLDSSPGTGHFRVPIETGRTLMRTLRGQMTGIAWPLYVLDVPGGYGKIPIGPEFVDVGPDNTDAHYVLTDPWGGHHLYNDSADERENKAP